MGGITHLLFIQNTNNYSAATISQCRSARKLETDKHGRRIFKANNNNNNNIRLLMLITIDCIGKACTVCRSWALMLRHFLVLREKKAKNNYFTLAYDGGLVGGLVSTTGHE